MTIATKSSVSTYYDQKAAARRSHTCDRRWRVSIRRLASLVADEDGTTAVEYAVMVAMIAVAVMGSVQLMTNAAQDSFSSSADAIGNA